MDARELAEATKEFDREFVRDSFGAPPSEALAQLRRAKRRAAGSKADDRVPGKPLTPAQRNRHRRARRNAGRSKPANGSARVLITIERRLLARADAHAKAHGTNRSQLIAKGLKALLGNAR